MEEKAQETQQGTNMPVIGKEAPDFEALTTHGKIKLSDFRGKWVILFSHPADFTPVCTTEFMAFAEIYPELQKRNTQLIGLSVDSIFSHIAWIRNIKEKMGVEIPFPVIADLSTRISNLYGMIQPGESSTATVRAVFFIDPEGRLRAMLYYPMSNGRNMQEVLRLLEALQTSDEHKIATPANWKPGEPVIVPPPATDRAAEKRLGEGYDCKDWYLCFKKI